MSEIIATLQEHWFVQSIQDSGIANTVTVQIRRLSDNYLWDFDDETFKSSASDGNMIFVNDILWKQSFTPPTADTYIALINNITLDVKFTQVFVAQGSTTTLVVTPGAASLIDLTKKYIPAQFGVTSADDAKILAYLNLVIGEINVKPPSTSYTLDNMPTNWTYIVAFGACVYATLFMQAGYSFDDFNYSDGGLSLNIDRHGKLGVSYQNQYNSYAKMVIDMKKVEALRVRPAILLTGQFSTVFSGYLGAIFGSTFPVR